MRHKIHALKSEIYINTQTQVHYRWFFESEIKRHYFHVKSLDQIQLSNWRRYLDFEVGLGDETRICALFKRCLVPCAMYEEFSVRFAKYLESIGKVDEARSCFQRACDIFIPVGRPQIRLLYAEFEELNGNIESCRDIYKKTNVNGFFI